MAPSQDANATTDLIPPGTSLLVADRLGSEESRLRLLPTPSTDPNEPLNWSRGRKFVNYILVLAVTLVIFTALSIQLIFWQLLGPDVKAGLVELNNAQSINSAGLTVGCVFFIPFAIKYGRRLIYILSTACIFAMSVWSSRMTTVWELYTTNMFMGLAGAVNEAIVGMTIADLFFVHQRGTMNGFYLVAVMSGSFLTPLLSGVQSTAQGWRWCYYVLSICTGVILLCFIFFFEETKYIPTINSVSMVRTTSDENSPAQKLSTKDSSVAETFADAQLPREERLDTTIALHSWRQRLRMFTPSNESLWVATYRPLTILFTFPDVMFAAIQYGAGLSWLVNLSVTVTLMFAAPPYNFNPAAIGYMGLGPFVGNLLGSIYCGYLADRAVVWFAKRNHGWFESEMRLYLLHLPSLLISGGLIMYGVTAARGMHWIYPSVAGAFFGFGLGAFGDTVLTYVIDSHRNITGEAFVAIAFVRNVLGIVIGQVRTPWLQNMGLQNMFILQGVLALVIALLYIPMIMYGKKARQATASRYYKLSESRY